MRRVIRGSDWSRRCLTKTCGKTSVAGLRSHLRAGGAGGAAGARPGRDRAQPAAPRGDAATRLAHASAVGAAAAARGGQTGARPRRTPNVGANLGVGQVCHLGGGGAAGERERRDGCRGSSRRSTAGGHRHQLRCRRLRRCATPDRGSASARGRVACAERWWAGTVALEARMLTRSGGPKASFCVHARAQLW